MSKELIKSCRHFFYSLRGIEGEISELEVLGISWGLHIINGLYSILAIYMGVKSYEYFSSTKDFSHLILDTINFKFQKLSMLTTLFAVVLYPFLFKFGYKFWRGCFRFYVKIFNLSLEDFDSKAQSVLNRAFASNFFLVLPILGNILSNISFMYLIFHELKKRYSFSSLQASIVLTTPLFLAFIYFIFAASYYLFLVSMVI